MISIIIAVVIVPIIAGIIRWGVNKYVHFHYVDFVTYLIIVSIGYLIAYAVIIMLCIFVKPQVVETYEYPVIYIEEDTAYYLRDEKLDNCSNSFVLADIDKPRVIRQVYDHTWVFAFDTVELQLPERTFK